MTDPTPVDVEALAKVIAGIDGGRLADATLRAHDACLRAAHAALASGVVVPASRVEEARAEVEHWKFHAEEAGQGFAQVCKDAARISARNVALRQALEEARAEAWDVGRRTGASRAMRYMSDEPNLPLASAEDNPYRAAPTSATMDAPEGGA